MFCLNFQKTDSQENVIIPSDLLGETGSKFGSSSLPIYSDSIFSTQEIVKRVFKRPVGLFFFLSLAFYFYFYFAFVIQMSESKLCCGACHPRFVQVSYFVYMSEVIREHSCTSSSTGELGLPLPVLARLLIPRQMVGSVQAVQCVDVLWLWGCALQQGLPA